MTEIPQNPQTSSWWVRLRENWKKKKAELWQSIKQVLNCLIHQEITKPVKVECKIDQLIVWADLEHDKQSLPQDHCFRRSSVRVKICLQLYWSSSSLIHNMRKAVNLQFPLTARGMSNSCPFTYDVLLFFFPIPHWCLSKNIKQSCLLLVFFRKWRPKITHKHLDCVLLIYPILSNIESTKT